MKLECFICFFGLFIKLLSNINFNYGFQGFIKISFQFFDEWMFNNIWYKILLKDFLKFKYILFVVFFVRNRFFLFS